MEESRKRHRAAGLVPRDAWIHPDNAELFRRIEKQLRQPIAHDAPPLDLETLMSANAIWNTTTLAEALQKKLPQAQATVDVIGGVNQSIRLTMHELGDLPIIMVVGGAQILAEACLYPVRNAKDEAEFNRTVMRNRTLFALSSISIQDTEDGEWYVMYGNLALESSLDNVITEIETLAANVIRAASAFEPLFNHETH
ncbi:YjfI family protein [Pseudomonas aeruginosa]